MGGNCGGDPALGALAKNLSSTVWASAVPRRPAERQGARSAIRGSDGFMAAASATAQRDDHEPVSCVDETARAQSGAETGMGKVESRC
jgi:hypothetical protein